VFESESEQKYKNKYGINDIRSYPIRFHPYSALKRFRLEHQSPCGPFILLRTQDQSALFSSQFYPHHHLSVQHGEFIHLYLYLQDFASLCWSTSPVAVVGCFHTDPRWVYLIICIIQFVFSTGTVFFSHNNSARTVLSSQFSKFQQAERATGRSRCFEGWGPWWFAPMADQVGPLWSCLKIIVAIL